MLSVDDHIYGNIIPPEGGFGSQTSLNVGAATRWKEGSLLAPFDKEVFYFVSCHTPLIPCYILAVKFTEFH